MISPKHLFPYSHSAAVFLFWVKRNNNDFLLVLSLPLVCFQGTPVTCLLYGRPQALKEVAPRDWDETLDSLALAWAHRTFVILCVFLQFWFLRFCFLSWSLFIDCLDNGLLCAWCLSNEMSMSAWRPRDCPGVPLECAPRREPPGQK